MRHRTTQNSTDRQIEGGREEVACTVPAVCVNLYRAAVKARVRPGEGEERSRGIKRESRVRWVKAVSLS
jgi:hypothetical protein